MSCLHVSREPSQWLCPSAERRKWPHLASVLCLIWLPKRAAHSATLPEQQSFFIALRTAEYTTKSHLTGKPGQKTQATAEPPTAGLGQDNHPAVLADRSQLGPMPLPHSELGQ